jgi:hypothetical protein
MDNKYHITGRLVMVNRDEFRDHSQQSYLFWELDSSTPRSC